MRDDFLSVTPDDALRAIKRLENPDQLIIDATWRNFPSPSDIDDCDEESLQQMLRAALLEALR